MYQTIYLLGKVLAFLHQEYEMMLNFRLQPLPNYDPYNEYLLPVVATLDLKNEKSFDVEVIIK